MESTKPATDKQRRPGGRTAEITRRINRAVLELLAEGGVEACTFQTVAARAGIERSTLYRRCPDRWVTIIEAIIDLAERETPPAETGTLREDLAQMLCRLAAILAGPFGPALMAVAAALRGGVAPEETDRFWESRRKQLDPMFDAAIARGEVAPDVNREEVFALCAGPLYFRTFVSIKPIDEAWIRSIVDKVCVHYCQ